MALGVYTGAVKGAKAKEYMRIAKDVTYTCWQMYARMPSGKPGTECPFQAGGVPRLLDRSQLCEPPAAPLEAEASASPCQASEQLSQCMLAQASASVG